MNINIVIWELLYSDGIIRGEVHASMKKKVYKVTVKFEIRSKDPHSKTSERSSK